MIYATCYNNKIIEISPKKFLRLTKAVLYCCYFILWISCQRQITVSDSQYKAINFTFGELSMKHLYLTILLASAFLNTNFLFAENELQLPDFAIVNISANSIKNHNWEYKPGPEYDIYEYKDTNSDKSNSIILTIGPDLSKVYAGAPLLFMKNDSQPTVEELAFLETTTDWQVYECDCQQYIYLRSTLTSSGLSHGERNIWVHVRMSADKKMMQEYKKWISSIKLEKIPKN